MQRRGPIVRAKPIGVDSIAIRLEVEDSSAVRVDEFVVSSDVLALHALLCMNTSPIGAARQSEQFYRDAVRRSARTGEVRRVRAAWLPLLMLANDVLRRDFPPRGSVYFANGSRKRSPHFALGKGERWQPSLTSKRQSDV